MLRYPTAGRFALLIIAFLVLATCARTDPSPLHNPAHPSGLSESKRDSLVEYALTLINQARTDAGVNELTLDTNTAAQSHAENSRAYCTRGHWDADGLKPYMRYTLAGGEQYSAENVFAIDFCPEDLDQYTLETPTEQIDYAMGLFMNSPGHRKTMLDPNHRKVGIGIGYRPPTIWFVQLFVGDYIEYETKPTIESGVLTLSGQIKNGATISDTTPTVMLYYDRPPEPLTRGQLSQTYCYSYGLPIARLRPPLEPGSRYTQDEATLDVESKSCPDPYDIAPDDSSPASSEEAHSNWEQARDLSQAAAKRQFTFPLITADAWSTQGDTFTMAADINQLLETHGEGVYTIASWGEINEEPAPISEYSIFVNPPLAPHMLHFDEKQLMLDMINEGRAKAGLQMVALGVNDAAQLHAESSIQNCSGSHWGANGLKPYMRYSLAGGYQTNSENFYGTDYCITENDDIQTLDAIEDEIRERMAGWMESPEHKLNILDPTHKKVNIGLAWDDYNFVAVQHFQGDYIHFDHLPSIKDGVLNLTGELINDAAIQTEEYFRLQIYFDQTPRPLTRGQLARSYCYDIGHPIAGLRPPVESGWHYPEHQATIRLTVATCPDPYEIDPIAAPPTSNSEAIALWQQARDQGRQSIDREFTFPWITADKWEVQSNKFTVSTDISQLIATHGDGVYTVMLWANVNGKIIPVSQYSIFIPPPP